MVRFSDIVMTDNKLRKNRDLSKQTSLPETASSRGLHSEEIEDIYPDLDSLPPTPKNNDIKTYYKLLFERVKDILKRVQDNREIHPYHTVSIFKYILDNELLEDFQKYAASINNDFAPISHVVSISLAHLKTGITLGYDKEQTIKTGFDAIIQSAGPSNLPDHILKKESVLSPDEIVSIRKKAGPAGGTLADLMTEQLRMPQKATTGIEKKNPRTDPPAKTQKGPDHMETIPNDQKALKGISAKKQSLPLKWIQIPVLLVLIIIGSLWYFGLLPFEKNRLRTETPTIDFSKNKISKPIIKVDAPTPTTMPAPLKGKKGSSTDTNPFIKSTLPPPPPGASNHETGGTLRKRPYSLHVGSFQSTRRTQEAIDAFAGMGISAYRVKVDLGEKGKWFRVFTGCYSTADEAAAFKKRHAINDARILKTDYAVQLKKNASKKDLDTLNNRLKGIGYDAYAVDQGNNRFQLLVGAFQTKDAALDQAMALKASGVDGEVISR